MPLRNVPITYTLDQQRQEINALAVDVNSIDINFEERVDDRVSLLISGGNGISTSYNDVSNTLDVSLNFAEFSSSSILEGTNLYYTSTRANAAIDGRVTRTFVNNLGITQVGTLSSLNVSGNVTGGNLNIVQWNLAASWGNHADAGYLTTYTETSTLDEVTDRGSTTVNTITVGALKTNSIASKLSSDNLSIAGNRIIHTGDCTVGSYSSGLANDFGILLDTDGLVVINHPSNSGGIQLRSAGTTNFSVDNLGRINGVVAFPASDGSNGQVLATNGSGQLVWSSSLGANVYVGDTPPDNAEEGDLWWESDSGRLKVYYSNGINPAIWVDASPPLEAPTQEVDVRNSVGTVTASNASTLFVDTNGDFAAQITTTSFSKIRVSVAFGRFFGTAAADGYVDLERVVGGVTTTIFRAWTPQNTDGPLSFTFVDEHGEDPTTLIKYQLRLSLNVAGSRQNGGITSQIAIQEL